MHPHLFTLYLHVARFRGRGFVMLHRGKVCELCLPRGLR